FLERRDEVLVEELADFLVGQGVDTQRFGIVSGKARVFKVPADVEDEDELLLLLGQGSGFFRRVHKLDRRAARAFSKRRARDDCGPQQSAVPATIHSKPPLLEHYAASGEHSYFVGSATRPMKSTAPLLLSRITNRNGWSARNTGVARALSPLMTTPV